MVARPSRLSSSAADEAMVVSRPIISSTGPAIPPVRITRPSQGMSDARSGASPLASPRPRPAMRIAVSPTPEPM